MGRTLGTVTLHSEPRICQSFERDGLNRTNHPIVEKRVWPPDMEQSFPGFEVVLYGRDERDPPTIPVKTSPSALTVSSAVLGSHTIVGKRCRSVRAPPQAI